ncbi:MAG: hypothetical protein ABIK83_15825 [Candidatus Zixiibacteriota bacterium]
MKKSKHDLISEALARNEGTSYNKGKGPDVKGPTRTIEVAVHESDLYSSIDQVKRYNRPYIATTQELIEKAKEVTKGTGIGVMTSGGRIVKRSRRKK